MIVVTGAAGFIGSAFISFLNQKGFNDIVAVDDFSREDKNKNLDGKKISKKIERRKLFEFIEQENNLIQFVFHLGARTDTTEKNVAIFNELNLEYSKQVWNACVKDGLPLVYASSAATYGLGEQGYNDDESKINLLKPLNPYGDSKNDFDKWALIQERKPYFWAGLKFFNVYGPNEYHKGRMASVAFHHFNQYRASGKVQLFAGHGGYASGEQRRDFVYVGDVVKVNMAFLENRISGIFNLGTGRAQSFNELAAATVNACRALAGEPSMSLEALVAGGIIEYIAFPDALKGKYQSFTQADLAQLRAGGYDGEFLNVEQGVAEYVKWLAK